MAVSSSDRGARSSRSNWATFQISWTAAGIGFTVSDGEYHLRRAPLHDLMHHERRQVIEQVYVIDAHDHLGA